MAVREETVADRIGRAEVRLASIENDPAAVEALGAIVDLYGEALARIMAGADPVEDELVAHLLLLHDLHPVDVETRVRRALEDVRPYLGTHGGDVELLGVQDGVARLRLAGTCNGCPSSAITLKLAIEEAILEAAPDLDRIEADGVAESEPQLLQIGSLRCPTELQQR